MVLVDGVVAVDHVAALLGAKPGDDPHLLVLAEVGDVLESPLEGEGRLAVAVQDLEVY